MSFLARTIMPDMTIYAHEGEVSCCVNGHPLARMARDVMAGGIPTPGDFDFVRDDFGFGSARCPECGGDVTDGPGVYFFQGEA